MSIGGFGPQFMEQLEKLELYFYGKLKAAKIQVGIEELAEDLAQDTALAVLKKLQQEKYNDYNLVALIWIKAKDVWMEYASSMKSLPPSSLPVENTAHSKEDFLPLYEQLDWLASIQGKAGVLNWDMLVMYMEGYPYKDIAAICNLSEAAVKMAIWRLKKRLRRDF